MWTDRYTVYYSKERHYAVRWTEFDRPEEAAEFKTFDDRLEAERLYNELLATRPTCRIELFFSQAKWVRYHANHDDFGRPNTEPVGQTREPVNSQRAPKGPVAS